MSAQFRSLVALLPPSQRWWALGRRLRSHAWALVFVLTASAIGQLAVLIQRPLAVLVVDSTDYLAVAHRIFATGQFTDPLRTPGYPAFLALVFLLTGKDNFTAVVVAQTMLMLTGTLGIYLLAHRVGLVRWAAASVAALVGIDPYLVNFERDVFTETLAFWLAVMLFLVFERYLRYGRRVALVGLVGLSVASILTRPVFIFIPLVLAAVMLRCAVSRARPRDAWRVPALVVGATYGLLVIYAGANGLTTGFFGLSDITDFNLFGKLVEYHMYELPVTHADAQALRLRADLVAYTGDGRHNAWEFINQPAVRLKYAENGHWRVPAELMMAEIREHPGYYVQRTLHDIVVSDYVAPIIYVDYQAFYTPAWIGVLLAFFTFFSRVYALLPILLIVVTVRAWRHPYEVGQLVLSAALLALSGDILITAISDDTDFWRLRVPLEWAMVLAFIAVTTLTVQTLARMLAAWRPRVAAPVVPPTRRNAGAEARRAAERNDG